MRHHVWKVLMVGSIGLALVSPSGVDAAGWAQLGSDIVGEASWDESGSSVSLSADGSRMAIGAPFNDNDRGHARVFQFINTEWIQIGADIDGEAEGDLFGTSVSLSADGTHLAVGAPENRGGGGAVKGHVRVFEWFPGSSTWLQVGPDIDGADFEELGNAVSLDADGSRVAIGSSRENFVRVFTWSEPNWYQLGPDISGETTSERFGYSVSLSADGDRVAVGAPYSDANSFESGRVQVFKWFSWTSTWLTLGQKLYGEGENHRFGWSVSLSADGSRLASGSPTSGAVAGQVRVFDHDGSFWVPCGSNILGENDLDQFGSSVSISADGTRVAAGAPFANALQGHVRVFEFNDLFWVQTNQTIGGSVDETWFGYSVSLSADGTLIAIGTPVAPAIGSIRAGVSRVFVDALFVDGFESGDTTRWNTTVP